jgi:hypothetical protein
MFEQVSFPVLLVQGAVLEWSCSAQQIRTCTAAAFKNGWFNGLLIFDSSGRRFRVGSATFLRKTGKRAFRGLFAPELIEVDLLFEGLPEPVPLEKLKVFVKRALRKDLGFWESSGFNIDSLLQSIDKAQDAPSVWKVLHPLLQLPK